jgi:dynein heavy chain
MISIEHKKAYELLVDQVLEKVFKKHDPIITAEPCFYTSLVDGDYRYQTLETIKATIEDSLSQYNSIYKNLNLVLFTSAVEHIVRVVRILSSEGSHMLLIGLGGSGRKSVCRLAVYICFSTQAIVF